MSKSNGHSHKAYWRSNLRLVAILLAIWFLFGCVFSIFLVEPLNRVRMGGFPLGFWIAQQGTIVVFILLVLTYCLSMKRLDHRFGVHEEEGTDSADPRGQQPRTPAGEEAGE